MIVLSERTLRAAGVDFDTAVALVGRSEGELVVRIMNVHEPQERPSGLDETQASPGVDAFSSLVVASDAPQALKPRGPAAPAVPNVLGLPRLERGCSLGDARAVARALRAELEALEGGGYRISSPFGVGTYPDLAAVLVALNSRSFGTPGGTHG